MTQDEIIEMAMQTGLTSDLVEELEAFAALVEEKATAIEREACAKVCEDLHPGLATRVAAEHIRSRKWL